eukprot:6516031-Prymnesium_polylepis.1
MCVCRGEFSLKGSFQDPGLRAVFTWPWPRHAGSRASAAVRDRAGRAHARNSSSFFFFLIE